MLWTSVRSRTCIIGSTVQPSQFITPQHTPSHFAAPTAGEHTGKVVPVVNRLSTMRWRHIGERRYSLTFLHLGTRWGWVVSFTPLPLYPRGKSPRYPLDRKLGGPQSRSGRCGEEKNLALPEIEPGPSSPQLYQLSYPDSYCRGTQ
jgi:hypothetical protein